MSARARLLLLACLAAAVLGRAPGFSGATFTSSTTNGQSSLSAAADWTPPTVAVSPPAGPVAGTTTVTATAADANSGVAAVVLEYTGSGGSTWAPLCTVTVAPYQCSWDTAKVADGTYQLRATATDNAGYFATAATTLRVDNTRPTVTITNPGTTLRGGIALAASASDAGSGVAKVEYQYAAAGTTAWRTACTATASPFQCALDTKTLTDGRYDFRAVATDQAGNVGTSTQATTTVANTSPSAASVQATNKTGGTAGTLEAGDTMTYTYNGVVDPGTLVGGWDGSTARQVSLLVVDGRVANSNQSNNQNRDVVRVDGVNLGDVDMGAGLVTKDSTVAIPATMTWRVVGGTTVVTVTLGAVPAGSVGSGSGAMTWTPSALAKSYAGTACSTTSVTMPSGLEF